MRPSSICILYGLKTLGYPYRRSTMTKQSLTIQNFFPQNWNFFSLKWNIWDRKESRVIYSKKKKNWPAKVFVTEEYSGEGTNKVWHKCYNEIHTLQDTLKVILKPHRQKYLFTYLQWVYLRTLCRNAKHHLSRENC